MTQGNLFTQITFLQTVETQGTLKEAAEAAVDSIVTVFLNDNGELSKYVETRKRGERKGGDIDEVFEKVPNRTSVASSVGYFMQLRDKGITERKNRFTAEEKRAEHDRYPERWERIGSFSQSSYTHGYQQIAPRPIGGIYGHLWIDLHHDPDKIEEMLKGITGVEKSAYRAVEAACRLITRGKTGGKHPKKLTEIDKVRIIAMASNIFFTGRRDAPLPEEIDTNVQFR